MIDNICLDAGLAAAPEKEEKGYDKSITDHDFLVRGELTVTITLSEMSKQIDINDLIPSALKELSRKFIDDEYTARHHDENLIAIRTRYEAYGKMAEGVVNVNGAMEGVKAGMRDCLKALNGMDSTYRQAAEVTYNALLDTFMAVAEMAVQTLNCIYQIEDLIAANVTPMEAMAAENIDDSGSENTDPVEDDELPDGEEDEENE